MNRRRSIPPRATAFRRWPPSLVCDSSMVSSDGTLLLQPRGDQDRMVLRYVNAVDETLIVELPDQDRSGGDGLSDESIARQIRNRLVEAGVGVVCVVCQEEVGIRRVVARLDCGHEFHSHCIQKWLNRKNLCPLCKSTALPSS